MSFYRATAASDVWSFGCLVYETVTRKDLPWMIDKPWSEVCVNRSRLAHTEV